MYRVLSFDHLLGMGDLSDAILATHFDLYRGYVKNVNLFDDLLRSTEPASPVFAELTRRFGWEWNGMRLHELYFQNLQKEPGGPPPAAVQQIVDAAFPTGFGSALRSFAMMRGVGWVLLVQEPETNALRLVWINEHDVGHLTGTNPILVLDVFEHAYLTDFGLKRASYLDAFMSHINWREVSLRLGV